MKFLLLCTDQLSEYFDKRIIDMAGVLTGAGHDVTIVTTGEHAEIALSQELTIFQIPLSDSNSVSLPSPDEARYLDPALASTYPLFNWKIPQLSRFWVRIGEIARTIFQKFPGLIKKPVRRFARILISVIEMRRRNINTSCLDEYEILASTLASIKVSEKFDVLVGCDLPGAIAAIILRQTHQKVWYDAHEYYSEQLWLKNISEVARIKSWEEVVLQQVEFFTIVSDGLLQLMKDRNLIHGGSISLPNASDHSRLSLKYGVNLREKLNISTNKRILCFHGVLSGDYRNLTALAERFISSNLQNWHLLYLGYGVTRDLEILASKSGHDFSILPAVSNLHLGELLSQCNVVVMPYSPVDINSLYGFPNKLGDCIELKIPFLYNEELKEIDKIARRFQIGEAFSFEELLADSDYLGRKLEATIGLRSNWIEANEYVGWRAFTENVIKIATSLEAGNVGR